MIKIAYFVSALVVFSIFSAIGYMVMTGGVDATFQSAISTRFDTLISPLVEWAGAGPIGAGLILIGSALAGYLLFGKHGGGERQY